MHLVYCITLHYINRIVLRDIVLNCNAILFGVIWTLLF